MLVNLILVCAYRLQHESAQPLSQECGGSITALIDSVLIVRNSANGSPLSSKELVELKRHERLHALYYLAGLLWRRQSEPTSADLALPQRGAEQMLFVDSALLKLHMALTLARYSLVNQELAHPGSAPF